MSTAKRKPCEFCHAEFTAEEMAAVREVGKPITALVFAVVFLSWLPTMAALAFLWKGRTDVTAAILLTALSVRIVRFAIRGPKLLRKLLGDGDKP